MRPEPISTRPLSDDEKLLREKFYASVTSQSELMDKLSEKLLTIELAIPGLFATSLKLIGGDSARMKVNPALYLTFGFWLAALVLTLVALTPKKWEVDPAVLRQDPQKYSEGMGIEDFFNRSALYKRRWVAASSILFFSGVVSALFTLG
jgi:hypothetical protein